MAALQALKELEKKASAATRSIKALDRRLADIETGAFSVRTGVVERRQELEAAEASFQESVRRGVERLGVGESKKSRKAKATEPPADAAAGRAEGKRGAREAPAAVPAATSADDDGDDDAGWLLRCDASDDPKTVSARLGDFLGRSLREVDIPPAAWLSDATFEASVRAALGMAASSTVRPPPSSSSAKPDAYLADEKGFWEEVRKALTAACGTDTLFLLRPKKWSARLIDLAAQFLSELEAAFEAANATAGEGKETEVAAVIFGFVKDKMKGKWATGEVTLPVRSLEEIGVSLDADADAAATTPAPAPAPRPRPHPRPRPRRAPPPRRRRRRRRPRRAARCDADAGGGDGVGGVGVGGRRRGRGRGVGGGGRRRGGRVALFVRGGDGDLEAVGRAGARGVVSRVGAVGGCVAAGAAR